MLHLFGKYGKQGQSKVDLEKISHICCPPIIDHRERYTFDKTDINVFADIIR